MTRKSDLRRRWMRLAGVTSFALLAACSGKPEVKPEEKKPPPPVTARAAVDRAVATTGDVITYTVTVSHDPRYAIDLPEPGAEIAGFRIIDLGRKEPREEGGRTVVERWYKLRADLVGSYVLPPVKVSYWPSADNKGVKLSKPANPETAETSAIFVEVESVLPAGGAAKDIRDIKPLRHPPSRIPWVWIIGGVLAVAAVMVAVELWRRRKRVQPPPPPAHEIAFAALDALRKFDFTDPEAVRRFHFAISETLRAYVEGRWGFNATDLTSEEIIAGLGRVTELDEAQGSVLQRFLRDTDQVKFAKYLPAEPEIVETYERALRFVEATRPIETPETAAAESEAVPS